MKKVLNPEVSRAIIPAAGFGTRLHPITKVIPKEMLPIGRKPVLEHIIEELVQAGLSNILIIISLSKEVIRTYFEDGSRWGAKIDYVIQKEMRGSGEAVLLGEDWINGQSFVVAWGDCVFRTKINFGILPLERLVRICAYKNPDVGVLIKHVERIEPDRYHSVRYFFVPDKSNYRNNQVAFPISSILRNPRTEVLSSTPLFFRASSRWLLSPRIFYYLKKICNASKEEILLTEAVYNFFLDKGTIWGVPLDKKEMIDDIRKLGFLSCSHDTRGSERS